MWSSRVFCLSGALPGYLPPPSSEYDETPPPSYFSGDPDEPPPPPYVDPLSLTTELGPPPPYDDASMTIQLVRGHDTASGICCGFIDDQSLKLALPCWCCSRT